MGTSLAAWVREVFARGMFAQDARVLGLTSEGNEIAWKGYAAVSAAKVALEAIARAIAVEYAPYGIRANIIQAGVTDTPALRLIPGNKHIKATSRLRNPFHRLTTPEDVANFIYPHVPGRSGVGQRQHHSRGRRRAYRRLTARYRQRIGISLSFRGNSRAEYKAGSLIHFDFYTIH